MRTSKISVTTNPSKVSQIKKTSLTEKQQPRSGASANQGLMLKRILVPVDFSEPSRKALQYAQRMAATFGAGITLLYVLEPIPYPNDFGMSYPLITDNTELLKTATEQLNALAAELAGAEPAKVLVRNGNAAQQICAAAQELNIDLIVISTHGYSGLKHVLLGSTAEKVVRHAHCPVLTV